VVFKDRFETTHGTLWSGMKYPLSLANCSRHIGKNSVSDTITNTSLRAASSTFRNIRLGLVKNTLQTRSSTSPGVSSCMRGRDGRLVTLKYVTRYEYHASACQNASFISLSLTPPTCMTAMSDQEQQEDVKPKLNLNVVFEGNRTYDFIFKRDK